MNPGGLEGRLYQLAVERNIPLAVQLNFTNRCNLACTHCYRVIEERPELTAAEYRDLLDQLAAAGTLQVTFSGGEPLLRRDFLAIARHARSRRLALRLYTAATLITPRIAGELAAIGFMQIHVSVYSDLPEIHDRIAEVPGAFERTMRGVRLLRERGIAVRLKCVVMQPNFDSFDGVGRLADELGCTVLYDPVINAKLDGDRTPVQLRLSAAQLEAFYRHPVVLPTLVPIGPAEACFEGNDDVLCGASHGSCSITPYGDVTPCIALPLVCGNVRELPFREIWERSPQMVGVRSIRTRDLVGCEGCQVAGSCRRCPGKAFVEEANILAPSHSACLSATALHSVRLGLGAGSSS